MCHIPNKLFDSSYNGSGNPNLIMFLVANKVDLEEKRAVGNEVSAI